MSAVLPANIAEAKVIAARKYCRRGTSFGDGIERKAIVMQPCDDEMIERGIFSGRRPFLSVQISPRQSFFHEIGSAAQFDHAAANFLATHCASRVGIHHHKVRLTIDIPNRNASMMNDRIQP